MPASPSEVFLRLVEGVPARRWDSLLELYAEPTNVAHPMSPLSEPALVSRADLRRHFERANAATAALNFRAETIQIHQTVDAEVVVAEFEYRGANVATGAALSVPCIFVLRVRDGRIIESRDYIDHAAFARALAPAAA